MINILIINGIKVFADALYVSIWILIWFPAQTKAFSFTLKAFYL